MGTSQVARAEVLSLAAELWGPPPKHVFPTDRIARCRAYSPNLWTRGRCPSPMAPRCPFDTINGVAHLLTCHGTLLSSSHQLPSSHHEPAVHQLLLPFHVFEES